MIVVRLPLGMQFFKGNKFQLPLQSHDTPILINVVLRVKLVTQPEATVPSLAHLLNKIQKKNMNA